MTTVIFDIDGTLTDTVAVDGRCYAKVIQEMYGLAIADNEWGNFTHVTDAGIAAELVAAHFGRSIRPDEVSRLVRRFTTLLQRELERDRTQFREVAGAVAFVRTVSARADVCTGLATGGWEESARLKLAAVGLDAGRYRLSTASQHLSREAILSDVIDQCGVGADVPNERIFYFGDGSWDYRACRRLGINFIGVDAHRTNALAKAGAAITIHDFTDAARVMNCLGLDN